MNKKELRQAILKEIYNDNKKISEESFDVTADKFDDAIRFLDREKYLKGIFYADNRPWLFEGTSYLTEKGERVVEDSDEPNKLPFDNDKQVEFIQKKLQVFVSSTFEDLKEERQRAVEAILHLDHIPAGMELFKASNASQLDTVKKWIGESDIYLLILGGKYGSIEPTSELSYTEIEYDYAVKRNIPVFALILTDRYLYDKKAKQEHLELFEINNPEKLNSFKEKVKTRMISKINNIHEIAIEIGKSINSFEKDPNIKFRGWVRPDNIVKQSKVYNKLPDNMSEKDTELYNDIVKFFEKDGKLDDIKVIASYCSYDEELSLELNNFLEKYNMPSNEFINDDIQTSFNSFLQSLDRFTTFLALNFFNIRGDLHSKRKHLYPDLNQDISGNFDHTDKYSEYVEKLSIETENVITKYKNFIRNARKKLY